MKRQERGRRELLDKGGLLGLRWGQKYLLTKEIAVVDRSKENTRAWLLEDVIREFTSQAVGWLAPHEHLLGPGRRFVVTVSEESVPMVDVRVVIDPTKLTKEDWKLIFSATWRGKMLFFLEHLREPRNKGVVRKEDLREMGFYSEDRDRLNLKFNKLAETFGVHYHVENIGDGWKEPRLRIVRDLKTTKEA